MIMPSKNYMSLRWFKWLLCGVEKLKILRVPWRNLTSGCLWRSWFVFCSVLICLQFLSSMNTAAPQSARGRSYHKQTVVFQVLFIRIRDRVSIRAGWSHILNSQYVLSIKSVTSIPLVIMLVSSLKMSDWKAFENNLKEGNCLRNCP